MIQVIKGTLLSAMLLAACFLHVSAQTPRKTPKPMATPVPTLSGAEIISRADDYQEIEPVKPPVTKTSTNTNLNSSYCYEQFGLANSDTIRFTRSDTNAMGKIHDEDFSIANIARPGTIPNSIHRNFNKLIIHGDFVLRFAHANPCNGCNSFEAS